MKFIAQHGKTYASKSDFASRFETFSANVDRIEEHNSKELSFKMGINSFADMTLNEFESSYIGGTKNPNVGAAPTKLKHHVSAAVLPANLDWNALGKVSEPGD